MVATSRRPLAICESMRARRVRSDLPPAPRGRRFYFSRWRWLVRHHHLRTNSHTSKTITITKPTASMLFMKIAGGSISHSGALPQRMNRKCKWYTRAGRLCSSHQRTAPAVAWLAMLSLLRSLQRPVGPYVVSDCSQSIVEFAFAYAFGIAFQYFPIRTMRRVAPAEALLDAIKADTLSLTAFQIGMYVWMAIPYFLLFQPHPPEISSPVFWFMMQIGVVLGFITTYPANWLLVKWRLKSGL
jgi:Domain of unknown function (DUF4396)